MAREQVAMVRAFDRYACMIKPKAGDTAAREQLVEVKFARARTYFEAQHWAEAAVLFREIALDADGAGDAGLAAAQLYLESVHVLDRFFGKTSCEGDMTTDVVRFLELYCAGAPKDADSCTSLKHVEIDLRRLRAQRLVEQADKLPASRSAEGQTMLMKAGNDYFDLFRTYCSDPVAKGTKPEADRCDELAYDAAKAFQAARLLAKAIAVRRALVAYDQSTKGGSPLAKKARYEIGANFQAIAVYDRAAEWFEGYARLDPKAPDADRALSDAVLLRLGLGQETEALKAAADFVSRYGATRPTLAGGIAFALGAHHAEKGDWEKARVALSGPATMAAVDRAPLDVQLQAHATLGRALSRLGPAHAAHARAEYARVRSLFADPASIERSIHSAYPTEDEGQQARRLGRAIAAVGEAIFFAAEERRASEVDVLRFPEYRGPGDVASVKAHIETKVKDWYLKKKAAIVRVEAEYAKVLDLKPKPPPRWIIAAGARSGLMWGDFVDDFRRSPIPKAWSGTPLEQVYTTTLDERSEPFKAERAKPALKKCLDLSVSQQYFDAFSRSCEVWLAKHYKGEYHVVDELAGAPTLVNDGVTEHPPPISLSGR
jgi:hypothetical protein